MTNLNDELNVAQKYGLFWACGWAEDDEGERLADGLYIYQPERFSETFFVLFDKLRQLNDYCFQQLLTCHARLDELVTQRDALAHDCGAEDSIYFAEQVPMWTENLALTAQATPVVLLCSFVEWGLKLSVKEICGTVPRKSSRSTSDIDFLLGHIAAHGGLQLQGHQESVAVIDSFRLVRNAFAHGNWEALSEQLSGIRLRQCFTAVSQLFECIEAAAWQSPWGAVSLNSTAVR